ncbi:formyl transferase [Cladorrhinum sp. PSN259]|nr:formyl transferase [Cladorrhinum sp. PSN259]
MLLLSTRPLFRAALRPSSLLPAVSVSAPRSYSIAPTRKRFDKPKSDPLRILFCGSDYFSSDSLKVLHDEMVSPDPDLGGKGGLIKSIDVMVRPPKPTGRGNKEIYKLPLHLQAEAFGLPIYERDTFTGWDIPSHINLIIAVSFGLFVPRRILSQAKYGGLNVHPSILPDLRGPAPIHHAILNNYTYTGVSVQTLSPEAFDHGTVLAHTPAGRFLIGPHETTGSLRRELGLQGAKMLIRVLKQNLHVQPHVDVSPKVPNLIHAPKISIKDKQVDWLVTRQSLSHLSSQPPSARIYNQQRALGTLWTHVRHRRPEDTNFDPFTKGQYTRVQLEGISVPSEPELTFEEAVKQQDEQYWNVIDWAQSNEAGGELRFIPARWALSDNPEKPGQIVVEIPPNAKQPFSHPNPTLIYIDTMKIAGEAAKDAVDVAKRLGSRRMTLSGLRDVQAANLGVKKQWGGI